TEQDAQMGVQYLTVVLYKCPGGATSCDPPPDMAMPPDMAHHTTPSDFSIVHDLGVSDDGGDGGGTAGGCSLSGRETLPASPWALAVVIIGAAGLLGRRARR